MDRKLAGYLPQPLAELREFQLLTAAEDPEFDLLWDAYDRVLDSAYIETADEAAIERYEKMFEVIPGEFDSLEDRRAYISVLLSTIAPYTYPWFAALLKGMYGDENIDITLDANHYKLSLDLKIGSKFFSRVVRELARKCVPANILVNIVLDFNRWEDIRPRTWSEVYASKWYEVKEVKEQ
ncbi:MAG: YmfQ family protein [Clostridiales Family XIII bacterium]|jgi:hypothetical protein|nr:YmfQ family protein [Clostridiales Family XIII bacterium]